MLKNIALITMLAVAGNLAAQDKMGKMEKKKDKMDKMEKHKDKMEKKKDKMDKMEKKP